MDYHPQIHWLLLPALARRIIFNNCFNLTESERKKNSLKEIYLNETPNTSAECIKS